MTVDIVVPDTYEAATEGSASQHGDEEEGEAEDEILVSCRCESAKTVATLLQCLRHVATGGTTGNVEHPSASGRTHHDPSFASQTKRPGTKFGGGATRHPLQPVTVFCSPSSLTFHMYGAAKQCQASVDLQESLFSHYQVAKTTHPTHDGEETTTTTTTAMEDNWQAGGEFCVNLTKVLECLHVLGGHHATNALDKTQLSFTYNASSEVFRMELLDQESGILITAAIPGMIPPEDDLGHSLALAFRSSPVASRMIVKSDTLKEIVQELELVSGATQGTVSLGPHGLELAVVGHLGECLVSIPSQGDHVVSLELGDDGSSVRAKPRIFPLHSLLASMSGLDIAQETCITINAAGMMAIQHQVVDPALGGNPSFVDFILCCMEDDDDEDEEGDEHSSSQQSQSQSQTSNPPLAPSQVETERGTRNDLATRRTADPSDGDDSTDDGGEESHGRSIRPSIPLFGSLVTGTRSTASSPGEPYDRSSDDGGSPDQPWPASRRFHKRRGHASRSFSSADRRKVDSDKRRRTHRKDDNDDDNDDDPSGSSMGDAKDKAAHDGLDYDDDEEDAELEDASQPLDVTMAVAPSQHSPRDDREDGGCSSPELVYGRQD